MGLKLFRLGRRSPPKKSPKRQRTASERAEKTTTCCRAQHGRVVDYLRRLPAPKALLWCYLIWYAVVAVRYFDPHAALWASSVGLSAIIGTGLYVSTAYAEGERRRLGFWPVFRFYLMPFCVSSFAALIKGHGFVLIFHPDLAGNATALLLCALFCSCVALLKAARRPSSPWEAPRTPAGNQPRDRAY